MPKLESLPTNRFVMALIRDLLKRLNHLLPHSLPNLMALFSTTYGFVSALIIFALTIYQQQRTY